MKIFISFIAICNVLLFSFTSLSAHEKQNHSAESLEKGSIVSIDIKFIDNTVHLLQGEVKQDQHHLWYQSSTDQGKTWSQAVDAFSGLDLKARMHRGTDARFAVQGDNLVAVWTSLKLGAPHNSGPVASVRSEDGGQSWQLSAMPADWNGSHGFFAMDGNDDRISLTWLDSREQIGKGTQGLRFTTSTDGGLTWAKNDTLDPQTCACCWNTATFDNEGDFYILYRDKKPSDMALGRVNKQQQWQRLNTVGEFNWDFDGCPHIGGGLAIDEKQKRFHATVGTGLEENPGVYYLNSIDKGLSWSNPIQLGDSSAVHSDIAVANNGQLLAAWDHLTEFGFQIVYATSMDNGVSWSIANTVSAPDKPSSHPRIAAMDDAFLVVWTESDADGIHSLKTKIIAHDIVPKNDVSTLPVNEFVKGSFVQIQQENEGAPYLVLFWSETCAYCMKELEHLGQASAEQKSAFKLITVSTDPFMDKDLIRQKLTSFNLSDAEAWVFSAPSPETLYFDVDKRWRGALPLTFLFDRQNNKIKKMGMLKQSDLTTWLETAN